jgi:hypothetical protein
VLDNAKNAIILNVLIWGVLITISTSVWLASIYLKIERLTDRLERAGVIAPLDVDEANEHG